MFKRQYLSGPYILWVIGFILLPILMIFYYGITDSSGNLTFENLLSIVQPVHLKSLWLSIKLALICTVICLILSYPLAMILNSLHLKRQSFVVFIFVLPMWMNFMLRILAYLYSCRRRIWNGIRFSAVYDSADLQCYGPDWK